MEQIGIPVGRVSTLYLYPASFLEFLIALGHTNWASTILQAPPGSSLSSPLHTALLDMAGRYLAIGGMPEAINEWIKAQSSRDVKRVHADLIYTYEQDFGKYARRHQIRYLHLIFLKAAEQLSHKFMFSRVGEYQKRELAPALELLEKAGLLYKVIRSAGQGIPIGAQADLNFFKIIFLDVGLCQALLKLPIAPWFTNPLTTMINKGQIVESFVGQELLAYSDPMHKESLFYWHREQRGSKTEVDYLIQQKEHVIPIEVKAGISMRNKSMQLFLVSHPYSPYGIRIWAGQAEQEEKVYSFPLYAIAHLLIDGNNTLRDAFRFLIADPDSV